MKITGVEPKLLIVSTFVLDNIGLGTVRAELPCLQHTYHG